MDKEELVDMGYIPFDKSWHIRMGVLDLLNGNGDTVKFLEPSIYLDVLPDDLKSLYLASKEWMKCNSKVYVGESGTLYRFLQFADWKIGRGTEFITTGTLTKRRKEMCQNPDIVNWPLEELLALDDETTQWASAAVIYGSEERIETGRCKLKLTYEAVDHWHETKGSGNIWQVKHDNTLAGQAAAYLKLLNTGRINFKPEQPEDYCFARAFGIIRKDEVDTYAKKWKSLRGHESNRILEMETALLQYREGNTVESRDHRVVQAIAMLAQYEQENVKFENRNCVAKSWPKFWKFLQDSTRLSA